MAHVAAGSLFARKSYDPQEVELFRAKSLGGLNRPLNSEGAFQWGLTMAAAVAAKAVAKAKTAAKKRSEIAERLDLRAFFTARVAAKPAPLVNTTTYRTPVAADPIVWDDRVSLPKPKNRRFLRYWVQSSLREIQRERQCRCSRNFAAPYDPNADRDALSQPGGPSLYLRKRKELPLDLLKKAKAPAEPRSLEVASFRNLMLCGSIWECLVCSARLRADLEKSINVITKHWQSKHGHASVLMGTFTYSHGLGDDLAVAVRGVSGAHSSMIKGKTWRAAKKKFGLVEQIRALEMTHGGASGWHPHLHNLYFFDHELTEGERIAFEDWLYMHWSRAVVAVLGERHRPNREYGTDLKKCHNPGYIAKFGLGFELTDSASAKSGKSGSRTPFEIARDYATYRRPEDALLWMNYCDAMRGQRAIVASRGLKLREPKIDELDDEAQAVKLCDIPAATWGKIRDVRGVHGCLLRAAEWHGELGVRRACAELLDLVDQWGSSGPPPRYLPERAYEKS